MPVPTCVNNCDAGLPVVNFNDCAPTVNFSEIRRAFLGKANIEPFTDWTQAAEWIDRLSQTSLTGNYIRPLTVIGDKPAGTGVIKDISNGRKVTVGKDHTLNLTVDDMTDENYEFMRALECGGQWRLWYETEGGYMHGGNEGILINIDGNHILNRGRDETETIAYVVTWRAKFHPERTKSPIFGSSTGSGGTSFDTAQTFASDTEATSAGITSTAPATDPDLKFEFNAISSPSGTPFTMNIKATSGGPTLLVVSAPSEYLGNAFKFTDISGFAHYGTFASGNVVVS